MGRWQYNLREAWHALCTGEEPDFIREDSDEFGESFFSRATSFARKKAHAAGRSLGRRAVFGAALLALTLSPYTCSFHHNQNSSYSSTSTAQTKSTRNAPSQKSSFVSPETPLTNEISNPKEETLDLARVIRADTLLFHKTTDSTNHVIYGEDGICVPAKNYSVLISGEEFFPDEHLHIHLPRRVLNGLGKERVRLTKFDPTKTKEEKYLASIALPLVEKKSPEERPFSERVYGVVPSPSSLEETFVSDTVPVSRGLEGVVGKNSKTTPFDEPVQFACIDQSFANAYFGSYVSSKSDSHMIAAALMQGQTFTPDATALRNKDDSLRSKGEFVGALQYQDGQSFKELADTLHEKGFSDTAIAREAQHQIKELYNIDMTVNYKQVRKIRENPDTLFYSSEKEYANALRKNPALRTYEGHVVVNLKNGGKKTIFPTK